MQEDVPVRHISDSDGEVPVEEVQSSCLERSPTPESEVSESEPEQSSAVPEKATESMSETVRESPESDSDIAEEAPDSSSVVSETSESSEPELNTEPETEQEAVTREQPQRMGRHLASVLIRTALRQRASSPTTCPRRCPESASWSSCPPTGEPLHKSFVSVVCTCSSISIHRNIKCKACNVFLPETSNTITNFTDSALSLSNNVTSFLQILLYPQDNLSPVLCHAPVSRAWWTSSTGHVTVTRAVPRQWWSTWPEGHSRGMAPVVATSKGQSRPPGRRPLLAYSNPSPSSHGSEMVKSDRRGLILTKPNFIPRRFSIHVLLL